jgi:hypothetical protein
VGRIDNADKAELCINFRLSISNNLLQGDLLVKFRGQINYYKVNS